jgi:hypothetical protein
MALLDAVTDGDERETLSTLTIGARDARLLQLRSRTFGDDLQAQTYCPACGEQLEFAISVADLSAPRAGPVGNDLSWHFLDAAGWNLRFRLPRALDLIGLDQASKSCDPRRAILERCVDNIEHDGSPASVAQLPEEIITALAERMEELDPCADILLALSCNECGRVWQAPFDIVGYLWAECGAYARRLLREVDALARAYGWREADILAMSSRRRRAYLELPAA